MSTSSYGGDIPSRKLVGVALTIIRGFLQSGDVVLLKPVPAAGAGGQEEEPLLLGRSRLGVKRFLDELDDGGDDEEEDDGNRATSKAVKRSKEKGPRGGASTNNNRRKEAARLKKAVKDITDVWRENDDGDEVQVDARALLLEFKPRFDWLARQPDLDVDRVRATKLVRLAQSVGDTKAFWDWRTLLLYWRGKGRLLSMADVLLSSDQPGSVEVAPSSSQAATRLILGQLQPCPNLKDTVDAVFTMYDASESSESCATLQKLHERFRLSGLYEQYYTACSIIDGSSYEASRRALANGRRTTRPSVIARDDMFRQIYIRQLLRQGQG